MSKILDHKSIIKLAKKHGKDPFNARDEALIALAGLAYFSANELSLLKVSDLVSERKGLVLDGYLPPELNVLNKARYFFIGQKTYLRKCLEQYIDWRLINGSFCLDRNLYCGLDPESYFFLKDDGSQFDVNFKNRFEGDTITQPLQMQRHFQNFILGEGVTINTLMDSFVVNFWNERSKAGSAQAIRDLMDLTVVSAETLRKKCTRKQPSVQDIFESLYK